MNPVQCTEMLALLHAAYPKEPMPEALMDLYTAVFGPWPVAAVRHAVLAHIATSPFFPKVSDLLGQLTAGETLDGDQAWAQVQSEIRRVGIYDRPTFADPVVGGVVRTIGWTALCTSTAPDVVRGQFQALYAQAQKRAQAHAASQPVLQALADHGLALPAFGAHGAVSA